MTHVDGQFAGNGGSMATSRQSRYDAAVAEHFVTFTACSGVIRYHRNMYAFHHVALKQVLIDRTETYYLPDSLAEAME